jgi:hypothetical protein
MIESDLYSYLSGVSAVSALAGTRLYPLILPQAPTYPAITYTVQGADRDYTYCGPSGLVKKDIQIDAWGSTYAAAKALQDVLRVALDGFVGLMGNTRVHRVEILAEIDVYEDEPQAYRSSYSFVFHHWQ